MADRQVRFAQSFFDQLDAQFADERGVDGRPSRTDVIVHEVPPVRDLLAQDFERNTVSVPGIEGLRVLVGAGALVRGIAVYAWLTSDGVVEVIGIAVEEY
jgi:hypothetical protein